MKKNNNYLFADMLFVLAMILLFCDEVNKWVILEFFVSVFIPISIGFCSSTKVKNNSENTIKGKSKNGNCNLIEIKSGEENYDVDMMKIGDRVYKIFDGTHVIVTKKGKVITTSFIGAVFNLIRGGFKKKYKEEL